MTPPSPSNLPELLILDREGVVLQAVDPYVLQADDVAEISGAFDAIGFFVQRGVRIAIATNQSPIRRGLVSADFVEATNDWIRAELRTRGARASFYVCPHTDEDGCGCRKPRPGLLTRAMADHDAEPVDTWMVGDFLTDIEAAHSAGCSRQVQVLSGRSKHPYETASHTYASLSDFARNLGLSSTG